MRLRNAAAISMPKVIYIYIYISHIYRYIYGYVNKSIQMHSKKSKQSIEKLERSGLKS